MKPIKTQRVIPNAQEYNHKSVDWVELLIIIIHS